LQQREGAVDEQCERHYPGAQVGPTLDRAAGNFVDFGSRLANIAKIGGIAPAGLQPDLRRAAESRDIPAREALARKVHHMMAITVHTGGRRWAVVPAAT
jgi:hypothetical protein